MDPSTSETYDLTHVQGLPVPMTWYLSPDGYRSEFVEGWVRIGPLHRFYQEVRHRETDNGVVVADSVLRIHGRFAREGRTLKVVYLFRTPFGKGYRGRTYERGGDGTISGVESLEGVDIGVFRYARR